MANVPEDIEDPFGVPPRQQEGDRANAVAQWYDSVREAPEWRYIFVDILLKVLSMSTHAYASLHSQAVVRPGCTNHDAHLLVQGACALYYFFCTWFTKNFIINFVVTTVLIVVEFWFTKNIGGRRLTGMRWWQVPSSSGSESTWRFEHRSLEQVRQIRGSVLQTCTTHTYATEHHPIMACSPTTRHLKSRSHNSG